MRNKSASARPKLQRLTALLTVLLAALVGLASAQQYQSAEEVTDAMEALAAPATSVATMTMTITSSSGHPFRSAYILTVIVVHDARAEHTRSKGVGP